MKALGEVFSQVMPPGMGFDYIGMSFQEKKASEGVTISVVNLHKAMGGSWVVTVPSCSLKRA
ncbi:MAG: hypothetical protein CVU57_22960 [Deltaproteobacteria bacterium HGW-Deltaproteobacteria-15]|jgi:hypothetical protein|nr:MAG: hypothetical protein CVU57_22960 [Deltaproteobacteria bacterium HGW-Deltaproteobacteria-15]